MGESVETVVRRFLGLWAAPEVDTLLSYFSDDAVWTDGPRGTHRGRDAIKAELESAVSMFPSTDMEVTALVANGNTVMMERLDHFEVGGKPFTLEIASVLELDADRRITRWREYYDLASIVEEINAALSAP